MKNDFLPWLRMLAAAIALGALSGCAGTPSSPGAGQKALAADLHEGMTPDEVRQALGNPADIRPMDTPEGKVETWVYRRRGNDVVEQRPTGTQEVPYVDPVTGVMRTIPEPVYSQVTTIVTEELSLLWINGELVSWKTIHLGDRSYQK